MAISKVKTENHEEWKALRGQYIGGSDAAAVVGLNPYRSQYSLWAEKTGRLPGFEGNLATEVGTYLEEFVAQKFSQVTGKKVRRANLSFLNTEYPWAIANIDREIVGEDAGLEIKTTSEMNLRKFKGGEYPAQYYGQAVHYMAVTGKKRWYLAVLIGNREFRWFVIERDEAEIKSLMDAEEMFWSMVQKNTPPMADGSKATTDALSALYPVCTDPEVSLFGLDYHMDMVMKLQQQIAELEKQKDEHANTIKSYMRGAERGDGERFRATWRTQTRRTFDHKAFAAMNPDMDLSGYYKVSTSRVFRVTEMKGA